MKTDQCYGKSNQILEGLCTEIFKKHPSKKLADGVGPGFWKFLSNFNGFPGGKSMYNYGISPVGIVFTNLYHILL